MAETREVLPYPILGVEGGGGDQGATAKPSGWSSSTEPASGLGPTGDHPSRGWQPMSTAPRDGRWVWGEWPELKSDTAYQPKSPRIVALMRYGRPDPKEAYSPHWCREGRWTPGDDPTRWAPIDLPPAQGIEAAKPPKPKGSAAGESPARRDAPPSPPPPPEGLPEEVVTAIDRLMNDAWDAGNTKLDAANRLQFRSRSALDATILHHLSAARAERDQALVDLSIAQGPDPEQAFDEIGMASRQTTLGKHKAANYAHIRKVMGDLDAAGMTEAADTLLWAHWWRQNERSWTKYMRESCLTQQRAAESERDAARARAERAEKAIRDFLTGDYPHPRSHRPGRCEHGVNYWEECAQCDIAHFEAALAYPDTAEET